MFSLISCLCAAFSIAITSFFLDLSIVSTSKCQRKIIFFFLEIHCRCFAGLSIYLILSHTSRCILFYVSFFFTIIILWNIFLIIVRWLQDSDIIKFGQVFFVHFGKDFRFAFAWASLPWRGYDKNVYFFI